MVFELKERKKKTRVVCTIGPASENEKMLRKLILHMLTTSPLFEEPSLIF